MTIPGPTSANMQSLTEPFIDVKRDMQCAGDGVTDDSTAINNAINAIVARFGAGTVYFPPGTYLCKNTITLQSQVHLAGAGIEATIIKLANGVNADLMSASTNLINLAAASGASSANGIYNWSLQNLTLDGNKANQSSGTSYCLREYGFGFIVHNVRMRNGYSGGWLSDWNGGGTSGVDSMEAHVTNLKIHDCNGIGLEWGGPHDSQFTNMVVYTSGSHNIHIAPNGSALLFTNCHSWGSAIGNSSVAWLVEAGYIQWNGCVAEGSDTVNLVLLSSENIWSGGHIFGSGSGLSIVAGIQFGQQAGSTPYAGSLKQAAGVTTAVACGGCRVVSLFSHNEGANGTLWFANDGGNNLIDGCFFQNNGSILTGTLDPRTVIIAASMNGLTPDGTTAKGGIVKFPVKANQALLVTDRTNDKFNINTNGGRVELPNATLLRLYSDNYTTRTVEISGGTVNVLQSTAAAAIANAGTITTASVGVARLNPAANVTGIIMQAGTLAGQQCWVVNESAFSITMDVSGTSHVADGVNDVIPPNQARLYVYDSGTSLWYGSAQTSAGSIPLVQSATAVAIANSGTVATANIGVSRLNPASAVTGIIMAAGTQPGQQCWVVNEAANANSVTFAASGTSNVSDGVNDIIYGGQARLYVWDAGVSLWFAAPQLNNGTVDLTASSSAAAIAQAGTITTAGVGIARLNPAAARTQCIMQAGTIQGQICLVVNEAAFANSVQMDIQANSNVADGGNCFIPGLSATLFIWDGSLWYEYNKTQITQNTGKAFTVNGGTNDVFNVNGTNARIEAPNGAIIRMYSDSYTTRTVEVSGGTVNLLQSTSAAAIANGNTITTSGVGIARVNPAANVTGIIMQAGTLSGQQVWVVNESANTVTFAAASSNVADANTAAIPANAARLFVWDGGTSLWYRAA